MREIVITILTGVACAIVTNAAYGAGPKLAPGKWTFTTTVTMSVLPEPKVQTVTKCVTSEDTTRDPLHAMIEGGKCKTLSRKENDNSIDFEVECAGDRNMISRGKGYFTTDGDTASGHMDVKMTIPTTADMPKMPGLASGTLTMTQQWTGKRIGDCD